MPPITPKLSPLLPWLLALLGGLLLAWSFPPVGLPWLAAIALAPLLFVAAREPKWNRRFVYGYAAGNLYWLLQCNWIATVLEVHGGMGFWGGWGSFALFCLIKSVHLAVFVALAGVFIRSRFALVLVPALWVALERSHTLTMFMWLHLGNAGLDMPILARLAPWTGVYGISFVLALLGTGLTLVVLKRPRPQYIGMAAILLLLAVPDLPAPSPAQHSAVSLQPNINAEEQWTRPSLTGKLDDYLNLSLRSVLDPAAKPASLILWPEAPAPFYYETDQLFRDSVEKLARTSRLPFSFGSVRYAGPQKPLNSSLILDAQGQFVGGYDKVNLVPFGEYVPEPFGFVNRVTDEAGDFQPGTKAEPFRVAGHSLGLFICYESVFPHFVRRFVADGAEVLVNQSNDGYFGKSAARWQHLLIVRMRAAENARWILRSTNNGVTAAIDPAGRLISQFPEFELMAGRLPYDYRRDLTLYTRWSDWFVWVCVALTAAGLAESRARGKSFSHPSSNLR